MPTVADASSASSSLSTRMPFGRRVARMRLASGPLGARLAQRLLPGQPDLAGLVHLDDLHVDDVALADDVGDLAHALVGQLRDVHQPVGARHDLDEGAEVDDPPHRAAIYLPDLRLRGERADAVDGLLHGLAVGRGHQHRAVVLDVDLGARLLDDAADGLAAGTDEIADAVGLDAQRDDTRRVGRQLGARRRYRRVHHVQDVQPGLARLLDRLLHDRAPDAADLDVHLHGGDAVARTGDLEVHVAQVVLVAEDVRQHADLVTLLDEPHGDAGDRGLDGDARLHERERSAADRGHGGGPVRFEDLGDDADGVREAVFVRQHRYEGALCERSVADLAPPRAAQELALARAEGREVVVQHELLVVLADQRVDLLLVRRRAERGHHQRLGLATREDGRAVCARQHVDVAGDGSDVAQAAPVEAPAVPDDRLAHDLFLDLVDQVAHGLAADRVAVAELGRRRVVHLVERRVALRLDALGERLAQLRQRELGDRSFELRVARRRFHLALRLPDRLAQLVLHVEDRLHCVVRGEERFQQERLGQDLGAALHHDDGVAPRGHDEVEIAVLELRRARVDHELAADAPQTNGRDRAGPRDVGQGQRRRRADDGDHVGIVLPIVRQDGGDDLRLATESLRKQRTHRTIDQPGREDLFLGGPSLALEEAARDLARCEGLLDVITGQRKEIATLPRAPQRRRRDQHDRLSELDERGAAGLLGDFSCLDAEAPTVEVGFGLLEHFSLSPRHGAASMILARRDGEKGRVLRCSGTWASWALLADTEPLDDSLVGLEIVALEVVEQSSTLAHELEEPATGMVILAMYLEVLCEIRDAIRQKRYLHLGGAGVGLVPPIALHDFPSTLLEHCHPALSVSVLLAWWLTHGV